MTARQRCRHFLLKRGCGQTSCNVRGAGEAAQRQVCADKDGSWRDDGVAPITDRVQRHPELQEQEGPRARPLAPLILLITAGHLISAPLWIHHGTNLHLDESVNCFCDFCAPTLGIQEAWDAQDGQSKTPRVSNTAPGVY